jgi:UDP-3-O-[3-hydroxymyristoyl] glucosamine N-acyltransferase
VHPLMVSTPVTTDLHTTLQALAQGIAGATCKGDDTLIVSGLVHPARVTQPSEMAYIASEKAWETLRHHAKLGVVEASLAIPDDIQVSLNAGTHGLLVVPRARVALALLTQHFEKREHVEQGIHPSAVIHPTAQIGEGVTIGAHSVVGAYTIIEARASLYTNVTVGSDVHIGEGSRLHAGVVMGDRTRIGQRCIIQPNAVIGADGFSYVTAKEARHEKHAAKEVSSTTSEGVLRINSLGNVVLEDDVEVGACTCIDKGTLAETRIAKGTKIDNLVQIGHNNTLGQHCLIVSQVGISGSCTIGNGVVIAGQTGLADHLHVGDNALIMARSGVMRDVEANATLLGAPALPHREAMANMAQLVRLREIAKDVKHALKRLDALEG